MIDVNDWDCRELYIRWNVAFVAFTDIAYPGHNFAIVCPLVHDIPFCKRADLCLRNEGVATTIKRSKVLLQNQRKQTCFYIVHVHLKTPLEYLVNLVRYDFMILAKLADIVFVHTS